jgi:hypothetical protein
MLFTGVRGISLLGTSVNSPPIRISFCGPEFWPTIIADSLALVILREVQYGIAWRNACLDETGEAESRLRV